MTTTQLLRLTQKTFERRGDSDAAAVVAATLSHASPAGQVHRLQKLSKALLAETKAAVAVKPFDKAKVSSLLARIQALDREMNQFTAQLLN